MKAVGHDICKVMLLLTLLFIFALCKKQETAKIAAPATKPDSAQSKVQELMLNNQSDIEENIDALIKLITEKQTEINKALEELKRKTGDLKQKEEQLAKTEIEMRRFRNVSYFILLIGLILIVVGLFVILPRRGSGHR